MKNAEIALLKHTPMRVHLVRLSGGLLVLFALAVGFFGLETLIMQGVFMRHRVAYLEGFTCLAATWLFMSTGFRLLGFKQLS